MEMNEVNAKVTEVEEIAQGLMIIKVVPNSGELADFKAGQFATLGVLSGQPRHELADTDKSTFRPPGWEKVIIRRPYTISSPPEEKGFVEFYISMVSHGLVTPKFFTLKKGDDVFLGEKFAGQFTLEEIEGDDKSKNLVLACTGTGLAPYISMLRADPNLAENRIVTLIHGVRHSSELGYRAEIETMAGKNPNLKYLPVVSRPEVIRPVVSSTGEEPKHWEGQTGHIQDIFKENLLCGLMGGEPCQHSPENTNVLLCGNPDMIKDAMPILEEIGYKEDKRKEPGNIFTEKYW